MPRNAVAAFVLCSLVGLAVVPVQASARDRSVGFGFNLAAGPSGGRAWDFSGSESATGAYFELANLEMRIFPVDGFSIDMQWNWLQQVVLAVALPDTYVYMQDFHFHFHTFPDGPAGVALGPFVRLAGGKVVGEDFAMLGVGGRFGIDLQSPSKVFGHGIYLRPAVLFASASEGDIQGVGWEMLLEMTWTWYGFKN